MAACVGVTDIIMPLKSSLPLPEVTQDADVVTKEKQRMAKLAVSGLAEAVSNALSSEA